MGDEEGRSGAAPALPAGVARWNWGAFLLNWIWGLGNGVPRALLTLVPGLNFVMPFVLGARGSAWAWRGGYWQDVAEFRRTQRMWGWAGVGAWLLVVLVAGFGAGVCAAVFYGLVHSGPYRLAAVRLRHDARCVALLGAPIRTGLPLGSIDESGSGGWARLRIRVHGARAAGWLVVRAQRAGGLWHLTDVELLLDDRSEPIVLTPPLEVRNGRAPPGATAASDRTPA